LADKKLWGGWCAGANILLAYFHYCNKHYHPFSRDCKDQDLRALGELDEQKIKFVHDTRSWAQEKSRLIPLFPRRCPHPPSLRSAQCSHYPTKLDRVMPGDARFRLLKGSTHPSLVFVVDRYLATLEANVVDAIIRVRMEPG